MIEAYPGRIQWDTLYTAAALELHGWGLTFFGSSLFKKNVMFKVSIAHLISAHRSLVEKAMRDGYVYNISMINDLHFNRLSGQETSASSASYSPVSVLVASNKLDSATAILQTGDPKIAGWALQQIFSIGIWTMELFTFCSLLKAIAPSDECWLYVDPETGNTLLHTAVQCFRINGQHSLRPQLYKMLLNIICSEPGSINVLNKQNQTVVSMAYAKNVPEIVGFLKSMPTFVIPSDLPTIKLCCETSNANIFEELITRELATKDFEGPSGFPAACNIQKFNLIHFLILYPSMLSIFIKKLIAPNFSVSSVFIQEVINAKAHLLSPSNKPITYSALELAMYEDINASVQSITLLLSNKCTFKHDILMNYISKLILGDNSSKQQIDDFLNVIDSIPDDKLSELQNMLISKGFLHKFLKTSNVYSHEKSSAILQKIVLNADLNAADDNGDSILHLLAKYFPATLFVKCIKTRRDISFYSINLQHQSVLHIFLDYLDQNESSDLIGDVVSTIVGKAQRGYEYLLLEDKYQRNPILIAFVRFLEKDGAEWFKSYIPSESRISSQLFISLCKHFPNFYIQKKQIMLSADDFMKVLSKLYSLSTFDPNFVSEGKRGYDYLQEQCSKLVKTTPAFIEVANEVLQRLHHMGARSSLQVKLGASLRLRSAKEPKRLKYLNYIFNETKIPPSLLLIPDENGQIPFHHYCASNWARKLDDLNGNVLYLTQGNLSLLNTPDIFLMTPIMASLLSSSILSPSLLELDPFSANLIKIAGEAKCPLSDNLNWCVTYYWPQRLLASITTSPEVGTLICSIFINFITKLVNFVNVDLNNVDQFGDTILDLFIASKTEYGEFFRTIHDGLRAIGAKTSEELFIARRLELCPELAASTVHL